MEETNNCYGRELYMFKEAWVSAVVLCPYKEFLLDLGNSADQKISVIIHQWYLSNEKAAIVPSSRLAIWLNF